MLGRCPNCGRMPRRSTRANRYYWELIHMISERIQPSGEVFSPDSWHTYFKGHYLGTTELKMPNGKTVQLPNSTADLDKDEFASYVLKVEVWAAEHGVYLDKECL